MKIRRGGVDNKQTAMMSITWIGAPAKTYEAILSETQFYAISFKYNKRSSLDQHQQSLEHVHKPSPFACFTIKQSPREINRIHKPKLHT